MFQLDFKVSLSSGLRNIFLGSKITADGDYSHVKRRLLLGRKVMTNLNSILKSRDFANKSPSSQGLACCSSWGRKELDTTELLNWTKLNLQRGSTKEEPLCILVGSCIHSKDVSQLLLIYPSTYTNGLWMEWPWEQISTLYSRNLDSTL